MKTLVLDTAWKNLVIALFEDDQLLAGYTQEAFKRQSETLFVALKGVLKKVGCTLKDLDQVIITNGPGSYTGLRMALTTAKILGTQAPIRVGTLTTFQLYAGIAPKANVLLDARGNRAYVAHVENGQVQEMDILALEDIPTFLTTHPGELYGEAELINQESLPSNFLTNAKELLSKAIWIEPSAIHALAPLYMKSNESYLVSSKASTIPPKKDDSHEG